MFNKFHSILLAICQFVTNNLNIPSVYACMDIFGHSFPTEIR